MKIWTVAALLLVSISGPALAEFKAETLYAMQMESWRVRMGFHQLAVRGNAPQDLDALEQVLHQGEGLISLLEADAVTSSEKDTVNELRALWSSLGQRALNNPLAAVGYADFNAFSEINSLTLDTHRLLQREIATAKVGADDGLYALGVQLLKMSSEYLALATFPSAGINTGTNEEPMAFSAESFAFEQQMRDLEESGTGGDAAARMLATLKTRWTFIKGAIPQLDDPDAARVPLLFYRYSSQTADDLLDMHAG